jgi:hypothetical protein
MGFFFFLMDEEMLNSNEFYSMKAACYIYITTATLMPDITFSHYVDCKNVSSRI